MRKSLKNIFLLAICVLIIAVFAGCGNKTPESSGPLQVNTKAIVPSAYIGETFDLRDVILMEDGVDYTATAYYVAVSRTEAGNEYQTQRFALDVADLKFTPKDVCESVVKITANRGKEQASKVVVIPTSIRAEPLDDLLKSDGICGSSDNGITKSVNMDSKYLYGETSTTSLHVNFNTKDPHPWGNYFVGLDSKEVQQHFTDQTWENGILTFWVYNPNEKAIEFQLRLNDPRSDINVDWSDTEGPHRQFALPGQWTQIFFSFRKMGLTKRITTDEFIAYSINLKFRYEDYSTTENYSLDFYLDNLDVVDGSVYPDVDTKYILSDESLEQGWENMAMDIGWQGVYTEYDYETMQGENSICSLKAYFNSDKALNNSFICLNPGAHTELAGLDMTGGKLGAYFKFENMDKRVTLDIVNATWQVSNQIDMTLKSVGDGWYYGEADMEKLQVGTGRNDNIIRIRFIFHGVTADSVVYMDTCKFDYKHIDKVLESTSVDLINMTPDLGSFYYNVEHKFVTSHLKGGNSVRSLKLTAPYGERGRYTWNTDAAATNGEISAKPNMTKGTLGAWFYFGEQAPAASLQVTSDNWKGSREIPFVFTNKDNNGWYYGELHGSDIDFFESANTKAVLRWMLIIPEGYTVYIDNLSWKANVETELVAVDIPKPSGPNAAFEAGKDTIVTLDNSERLATLSFRYKITSGEKFALALMPEWTSYYGYYEFLASGPGGEYNGVTAESINDGYILVTFDLKALDLINGTPTTALTMLYIRGEYTTATGVIEDISWTVDNNSEPEVPSDPSNPEEPIEPEDTTYTFAAGSGATIVLDNDQSVTKMSFDYKFESGNKMVLALMPDWTNYYGYYEFDLQGLLDNSDGVTTYALEDGYVRAVFDMDALNKVFGAPDNVITMIYVHGGYTEASGVIANICLNDEVEIPSAPIEPDEPEEPTESEIPEEPTEPEDPVEPENNGYAIVSGKDLIVDLQTIENPGTLSFEYKLDSGAFNLALLMSDWSAFYGYFAFDESGAVDPYDGITLEVVEDGYTRVTFDISALTKVSGSPDANFSVFYVRGEWTDANGTIRNISIKAEEGGDEPTEPDEYTEYVFAGDDFAAGRDLPLAFDENDYDVITFDYKITSGTELNICLMQSDWMKYYGYYLLGADGLLETYDGVSTELLDNGYIRVTLNIAELSKTNNEQNTNNKPAKLGMLYIRGGWSNAAGTIDNIRCMVKNQQNTEKVVAGAEFTSGGDLTLSFDSGSYSKISVDYKIVSGKDLWFCFANSSLSKYYGYYWLIADGTAEFYDGITYELLSNGYIRVTLDIAALNRTNHMWNTENAPEEIACLYIRGNWSDAAGIIDNIRLY